MSIRKFNFNEKGLERFFGPLEAKILDILWSHQEMSIKDVQQKLEKEKDLNFNTAANTNCFNPRTPYGVRLVLDTRMGLRQEFQSTHSVRSATYYSDGPSNLWHRFNPRTLYGVRPRYICR